MHRILSAVVLTGLGACGAPDRTEAARIHVEVTAGPHAGRYRVVAAPEACAEGVQGSGSVVVQYTDLDSGAALASLQLVATPDTGFYLGLVFGGLRGGSPGHEIETRPGRPRLGGGALARVRHGDTTDLEITGLTADGMPLSARVRCVAIDTTTR